MLLLRCQQQIVARSPRSTWKCNCCAIQLCFHRIFVFILLVIYSSVIISQSCFLASSVTNRQTTAVSIYERGWALLAPSSHSRAQGLCNNIAFVYEARSKSCCELWLNWSRFRWKCVCVFYRIRLCSIPTPQQLFDYMPFILISLSLSCSHVQKRRNGRSGDGECLIYFIGMTSSSVRRRKTMFSLS